jgi:ABC-type polysaccharide/polyol phosphate export permease
MSLAGFSPLQVHWPLLILTLCLTSLGLTAFGFAVAWLVDNMQGYHAIQMTLLIPLWIISGAMFPPNPNQHVFFFLMRCNPVSYAVNATRQALYGGVAPASAVLPYALSTSVLVLIFFAVITVGLATFVCKKR